MNKKYMILMGLGFEMSGLIIGGVLVGQFLDEKYQQGGLLTGLCAFLGLGVGLFHMLKIIKGLDKEHTP